MTPEAPEKILPLGVEHLDGCAGVFAAAFSGEPWNQPWTPDAARERLADILATPNSLGLVCLRGDTEVLGFALGFARRRADGKTFVLDELCVTPRFRGRGVATRLLDRLHDELGGAGLDRVLLETGAGGAAEALYEKFGYGRADGIAMVKNLRVRGSQKPRVGTRAASSASIEMEPIGFVRTDVEKVPRNFRVSEVEGTLEIEKKYGEGLVDIELGQRVVVIFHFHESPAFSPDLLSQTPRFPRSDREKMGIFSICSPVRPNPVGMSILDVLGVEGTTSLRVKGLDMRDGTPILDIKPWLGDGRDRPRVG